MIINFVKKGLLKFTRQISNIILKNTTLQHYPSYLIPKVNDKILKNNEIDGNHFLGKWLDNSINLRDSDGKLSQSAIDVDRIPGFSTNKIPSSKKKDLNIAFKDPFRKIYTKEWQEGLSVALPHEDEFELISDRQHYFIKISDINGFTDVYHNPPNKKDIEYKFQLEVVHKPTVSNYWHFEFHIATSDPSHKVPNANSSWRKLICSSVRDKVQEVAQFTIVD